MHSHGQGVFGIVAEPNKHLVAMSNPGYMMEDIEEEDDSSINSIPGTPLLGNTAEQKHQGKEEEKNDSGADTKTETSTARGNPA